MSDLSRDLARLRELCLESSAAQEGLGKLIVHLETSQIQADQRRNQEEMRRQRPEVSNQTGLDRWNLSQFTPKSMEEKVLLAWHCFALDSGFVCLEEMKNSTPGFAPSLREVPPARFVSEAWNMSSTSTPHTRTLMYKHKASKKRYDMNVTHEPGSTDVNVNLTEKGGSKASHELNFPAAFFSSSSITNIGEMKDAFEGLLSTLGFIQGPPNVSSNRGGSNPVDTRVGQGDIFPLLQGPGGGMVPNPAAGNLVGPDHPIFGAVPPLRDPGYPGLPQPRFDPYGPVGGTNGPFDPRYPNLGKEPGGPDPDHLKPPDIPDMMDPNGQFNFPGRGGGRGRRYNGPRDFI